MELTGQIGANPYLQDAGSFGAMSQLGGMTTGMGELSATSEADSDIGLKRLAYMQQLQGKIAIKTNILNKAETLHIQTILGAFNFRANAFRQLAQAA